MSEHLSSQNLERYRQSALPPLELLTADDHLAVCEQCRARLTEVAPAESAWQTLRSQLPPGAEQIEHSSYEQLAAYVDGKLDDAERRAMESHINSCEMCAAELQDLRAFSQEVAAYPASEPTPVSTAPGVPSLNWRQRFIESLTMRWPVLAGASALLLVSVGLLYFQSRVDQQSPPIVATVSPTSVVPGPSPAIVEGVSPTSVLALNDGGGRVTLDQEGRLFSQQPLPPAIEQMIKRALTNGRVETPDLTGLNVKTGSLMGGGEKAPFKLLEPLGKVIEINQPNFRWQSLADATSYTVMVYDANFNRVVTSPSLTANEWRPSQPLRRGAIYSWQVKAIKDGQEIVVPQPPAPEAKFKVLEQAKAAELENARRQFAGSHLTLGLLYAQAGLLGEAEQELQALVNANRDSAAAIKLLRSIKNAQR